MSSNHRRLAIALLGSMSLIGVSACSRGGGASQGAANQGPASSGAGYSTGGAAPAYGGGQGYGGGQYGGGQYGGGQYGGGRRGYGGRFGQGGQTQGAIPLFHGEPMWSQNRAHTAQENAEFHFERAGADLGARTLDDFLTKTHRFVDHPPAGTLHMTRRNGDVLLYDPRDNIFAVATADGAPRTIFKPSDGMEYWNEQKARLDEGGQGGDQGEGRPRRRRRYNDQGGYGYGQGGGYGRGQGGGQGGYGDGGPDDR